MPISQQLIRLARNIGALTADTNAIFEALRAKGVVVPANAQLSDVADMIETIEVPPSSVEIGGRNYPVVRIGNQLWMAENLDWKAPGINIDRGTDSTNPNAMYYNFNENVYGISGNKYGLLYNHVAVEYLCNNYQFPNGFHIPTSTDLDTLITEANNLPSLCNSDCQWEDGAQGTNTTGLNLVSAGSGYYSYGQTKNTTFNNVDKASYLWTSDKEGADGIQMWIRPNGYQIRSNPVDRICSIRLVKDVT